MDRPPAAHEPCRARRPGRIYVSISGSSTLTRGSCIANGDASCGDGHVDPSVGHRHAGDHSVQRRGTCLASVKKTKSGIDRVVFFCFQFLIPWARVGRCKEEVYDTEVSEKLWRWLEENAKVPTTTISCRPLIPRMRTRFLCILCSNFIMLV